MNLNKIRLYHGTSSDKLDSILKSGLLPWGQLGKHNWECEDMFGTYTPKEDCVYLANLDKARHYAEVIGGSNGIILDVKVTCNVLEEDEDSKQRGWMNSLLYNGTCAHKGIIPVKNIKNIYDLNKKLILSL